MFLRITFCLLLLSGLTINAQTIALSGNVSNKAGKPIANAIVTLAGQGLKDTTGPDGAYSISKNTAVTVPSLLPETERIFLNKGHQDWLPLSAEVVRTSRHGEVAHVRFGHLNESVRDQIVRIVNREPI